MNITLKFIFISVLTLIFSTTSFAQTKENSTTIDLLSISIADLIASVQHKVKSPAAKEPKHKFKNSLRVTATAYTSHAAQTDSTPNIAAWNDRIEPGMKIIAVSRDLLHKYGMKRNTVVKIEGLPGTYRVLDKMNKRFTKKIDLYMGMDRRKAFQWGKRKVTIHW
jgi:3D (Asp-Asp-Asp) domain-containing protein